MKKTVLGFLLFLATSAQAVIYETRHFNEIHSHLTPETLILLDIDDTLLIPVQMLGCDEWFTSRVRFHEKEGVSAPDSIELSLAEWEAVRHLTKMEIVEPGTEEHVHKLQEKGYTVMGLTTQGVALATRTRQQLGDHQIDLTKTSPAQVDYYFNLSGHGILFRGGILFTSGRNKGKALFQLLDGLGYAPKRILFINDKYSHLQSIEEAAVERGIEFVGLRYAYSDARKLVFSEKIADFQFSHSTFTHILSDHEARQLIGNEHGKN